jgi:hypothetical protein
VFEGIFPARLRNVDVSQREKQRGPVLKTLDRDFFLIFPQQEHGENQDDKTRKDLHDKYRFYRCERVPQRMRSRMIDQARSNKQKKKPRKTLLPLSAMWTWLLLLDEG